MSKITFLFLALLSLNNALFCQRIASNLGDFLVLEKTVPLNNLPEDNFRPVIISNYIYANSPENFYFKTGELVGKSNLVLDGYYYLVFQYRNRKNVEIIDSKGNVIFKASNAGTHDEGSKGIFLSTKKTAFYYQDSIFIWSEFTDQLTAISEPKLPQTEIISVSDETIIFLLEGKLAIRTINESSPILLDLGGNISGLYFVNGRIYCWVDNLGVVCLTSNFKEVWTFKPRNSSFSNVYLSFDDSCIYFSPEDIYCVSQSTGSLTWETKSGCYGYPNYVTINKHFLINYNKCESFAEVPPIMELIDKTTGQIIARGWTSTESPPDEEFGVSELDMIRPLSFAEGSIDNKIFAVDATYLYIFSIKDK